MKSLKPLDNYYKACNKLVEKFLKDLYEDDPECDYWNDYWWIGDSTGGIFTWGDWFVAMENITDYYEYSYTPDEFFSWWDEYLEKDEKLTMKHYKLLKGFKK